MPFDYWRCDGEEWSCSSVSWVLAEGKQVGGADRRPSEWRWQMPHDYRLAWRAEMLAIDKTVVVLLVMNDLLQKACESVV